MMIELLIGIFVGLLTTMAITQVLSVSEVRRRSAVAGGEAQVGGALALDVLQRDLAQSGYGLFVNPEVLNCKVSGTPTNGIANPLTMAPVFISNSGDAVDSSRLIVFSSSKTGASLPISVTANYGDTAPYSFVVAGNWGVAVNDIMVAVPESRNNKDAGDDTGVTAGECVSFTVDDVSGSSTLISSSAALSKTFNTGTHDGKVTYPYLVNLGSFLRYRTYGINLSGTSPNVLQMRESTGAITDLATDVVNFQALYVKSGSYDQTTPTTNALWRTVVGVRLAVVVRSTHYEYSKTDAGVEVFVTAVQPQWNMGGGVAVSTSSSGLSTASSCSDGSSGTCLNIKVGDTSNNEWKRYRYKVFDTQTPLRNMLWNDA